MILNLQKFRRSIVMILIVLGAVTGTVSFVNAETGTETPEVTPEPVSLTVCVISNDDNDEVVREVVFSSLEEAEYHGYIVGEDGSLVAGPGIYRTVTVVDCDVETAPEVTVTPEVTPDPDDNELATEEIIALLVETLIRILQEILADLQA